MKKPHIQKYTEDSYKWINEELRKNEGMLTTPFVEKASQDLRDELDTLPNYQDIVYRGVQIKPQDLAKYADAHENEKVIKEPTFVSTSYSMLTAKSICI